VDKLKNTEHDFNISLWIKRFKECRESGLKVTEWCRQNGIGVKTYYYWMRKIKREAIDFLPDTATPVLPALKSDTPIFSKVGISSDILNIAGSAVTVHFRGISIDIKDGTSEATIKNTLLAIRSLC